MNKEFKDVLYSPRADINPYNNEKGALDFIDKVLTTDNIIKRNARFQLQKSIIKYYHYIDSTNTNNKTNILDAVYSVVTDDIFDEIFSPGERDYMKVELEDVSCRSALDFVTEYKLEEIWDSFLKGITDNMILTTDFSTLKEDRLKEMVKDIIISQFSTYIYSTLVLPDSQKPLPFWATHNHINTTKARIDFMAEYATSNKIFNEGLTTTLLNLRDLFYNYLKEGAEL